jgi:chemotaxis protein methyltransferase CheR
MSETASSIRFGDQDYALFMRKVRNRTGIRLEDYKPEQMRRRIAAMAQQAGADSYDGYFLVMARSGPELAAFLNRMTINVSELFRNPAQFDDLQHKLMPPILASLPGGWPADGMQVWSAGCSHGAEAYSLAILMNDLKPGAKTRVWATDLDTAILDKAQQGVYTRMDMQSVSAARKTESFEPQGDAYRVKDAVKARVAFARHDLLADAYPTSAFDLIACRNVVIYFTDAAKARVYQGFYDALKPGGLLFIGGTERVADHQRLGFELVLPYFYRKPLAGSYKHGSGGIGTHGSKTKVR